MTPPKKTPSNLPATVTVILNPLRHLIEILILQLGLQLKICKPRAPHHTDTPFTESHHRAQSVFLTLSFPRLSFQLVIKKRSRRKVLSERFQSVFYCLKLFSRLTIAQQTEIYSMSNAFPYR